MWMRVFQSRRSLIRKGICRHDVPPSLGEIHERHHPSQWFRAFCYSFVLSLKMGPRLGMSERTWFVVFDFAKHGTDMEIAL